VIKKVLRRLLPNRYVKQFSCFQILAKDYGQYRSIKEGQCVDALGHPIPWYTYPAIEYLNQLDFSQFEVFEFGAGNSSIFWAERAATVCSVEDDKTWFEKIQSRVLDNQKIICRPSKDAYVEAIVEMERKFDLVIIDGNHRPECARQLPRALNDGGVVILDNSDWFKKTATYIREELDLIQVDFHGFGPINNYTWTTSIFFSRKASLKPLKLQPNFAISGLKYQLIDSEDY